jgi:hypothetical protein
MHRTRATLGYLLALIVLLGSCSDLALFSPTVEGDLHVKALSLQEGGFVEAGQQIGVVVQGQQLPEGTVLIDVSVLDAAGHSLWHDSVPVAALDEEHQIALPELQTGRYRLTLQVSGEDGVLAEKQISFFYLAGQYGIAGVSSYPPTVQPGKEAVITAQLLYPAGSDPYLRWSSGGSVLAKGLVSRGLDRISLTAPKEEGVRTIEVELFPVAPAAGEDFPFASALSLAARLYVSGARVSRDDALLPASSYYSLFHFNGTLEDVGAVAAGAAAILAPATASEPPPGARGAAEAGGHSAGQTTSTGAAAGGTPAVTAQAVGSAHPVDAAGPGGYRLSGNAAIRYDRLILPLQDGLLAPCTFTLKLRASGENASRSLLAMTADDAAFRLELRTDELGRPVAQVRTGSAHVEFPSGMPALQPDAPHRLDLSLLPAGGSLSASWFLDGEQTSFATQAVELPRLSGAGQTLLGGEDSFSGLVTELGVYFLDDEGRPAVDPAIYRNAMKEVYGAGLVMAEGFDGLYLPEGFRLLKGAARLEGGDLTIGPGATVSVPLFEVGASETALHLRFAASVPPGGSLSFVWEGQTSPFFTVLPEGKIQEQGSAEGEISFAPKEDVVEMGLYADDFVLYGASGPVRRALPPKPPAESRWLSLLLGNSSADQPLQVDNLLIYQVSTP